MPRIDPTQLLKTLSVLLAPHGGIKSSEEVKTKNINCKISVLTFLSPGQSTGPADAKVFQEIGFQNNLCQNIEIFLFGAVGPIS